MKLGIYHGAALLLAGSLAAAAAFAQTVGDPAGSVPAASRAGGAGRSERSRPSCAGRWSVRSWAVPSG